jgi:multicomponent Na+:H+ antiporter subunit G
MLLQSGSWLVAVKLVAIGLLILFASPTATHALANAARERGVPYDEATGGEAPSKP